MYSKSFLCEITVYPEFHKDQYSGYIQEQFNKWIIECFRAYTAMFKINVIQHGVKCYMYDSDRDCKDIVLKKLWQNQYGTYSIVISGEGIIMNGAKPIEPPISIAEAMVDKLTFKYKECSDMSSPTIIAYGKGVGLPLKYARDITDAEEWDEGFCSEDVYCPNFELDLSCSNDNFKKTYSIIKKIASLNSGEMANIESDPYTPAIKITTAYHLSDKNKMAFFDAINSLSSLVVEDNGIQIEKCTVDFSSVSGFALESYLFNEKDGCIDVKNISI